MQATLIINTHSSHASRELERVRSLLESRGIIIDSLVQADGTPALVAAVRKAKRERAATVLVGGGDGTMTQVANVLAHSKVTVGVLPLGTGNSFARTIGIGEDVERAIEIIAAGRTTEVDLGVVNKRYFVNFATIGFAAQAAKSTDHDLKSAIGPLAYVAAAIGQLSHEHGFRAKVRSKHASLDFRTQQLIVVNGRYFGTVPITPDATNQDGLLRLFVTEGTSRVELLKTYAALATGLGGVLPEAHLLAGKKFLIRTKPKQELNTDGDSLGRTPAHFSVERRALRVFVP